MTTRIYYDTEFIDDGVTIELISIGMVSDTGDEYYAINDDFKVQKVWNDPWLYRNVWPQLKKSGGPVKPRYEITNDVWTFITKFEYPELWGYHCAYDHVVLCQLFGKMVNMPYRIPDHTMDIKQEWLRLGQPSLPKRDEGSAHYALADAHYNMKMHEALMRWEKENSQVTTPAHDLA